MAFPPRRHADAELQLVDVAAARRVKARGRVPPRQRGRELEQVSPWSSSDMGGRVSRRRLGVEAVAAAALEVRGQGVVGVVDGSVDVDVQDAARVPTGPLVPRCHRWVAGLLSCHRSRPRRVGRCVGWRDGDLVEVAARYSGTRVSSQASVSRPWLRERRSAADHDCCDAAALRGPRSPLWPEGRNYCKSDSSLRRDRMSCVHTGCVECGDPSVL